MLPVSGLEEQVAAADVFVGGEERGEVRLVEQGLFFAERVLELLAQGRVEEEAVEVLHDEADVVLRNLGTLHVGQLLLIHLANGFGEVLVVSHEIEGCHLIDIAVHDEVHHEGEGLLLVACIVYHDGLEEGVGLVKGQEPVGDALHVLAAVQQRCLGEVGVESSLEAVLQVAPLQLDEVLDALEAHVLLSGEHVLREGFRFLHLLPHVLFGEKHEEHFVLHLCDEGLPPLRAEAVGQGRHQGHQLFVAEAEQQQVGRSRETGAMAFAHGHEAEHPHLLCVVVLPCGEKDGSDEVLLNDVALTGQKVVPEGCVLCRPDGRCPKEVEEVILHLGRFLRREQALPLGGDVVCRVFVIVLQTVECLAVVVGGLAETDGAAGVLDEDGAPPLQLGLHFPSLLVVAPASQEGEHVVVVLFETLCAGSDNVFCSYVRQECMQGRNAVQNVALCKALQAFLRDVS